MDRSEELDAKLKAFNIKYLYTMKMSSKPTPVALKLGCSLVALYFEKLEKPIDSQEIYEINQGLNQDLFNYYFRDPEAMFKEIQQSDLALRDLQIPLANVRFVQLILKDIDPEQFEVKTPVIVALKYVYELLSVFVEVYFQRAQANPKKGRFLYYMTGCILKVSFSGLVYEIYGIGG